MIQVKNHHLASKIYFLNWLCDEEYRSNTLAKPKGVQWGICSPKAKTALALDKMELLFTKVLYY